MLFNGPTFSARCVPSRNRWCLHGPLHTSVYADVVQARKVSANWHSTAAFGAFIAPHTLSVCAEVVHA